MLYQGGWYPICGYSFWNNGNGAATICKALEFGGGTLRRASSAYGSDAMPIGACGASEPLDACTLSPPTERGWGLFNGRGGWCK